MHISTKLFCKSWKYMHFEIFLLHDFIAANLQYLFVTCFCKLNQSIKVKAREHDSFE